MNNLKENPILEDAFNPGGGSGGDMGNDDAGNQIKYAEATYQIGGNQVVLLARPTQHLEPSVPPKPTSPGHIMLLAGGVLPQDVANGSVDIRGAKSVRITSGPPAAPLLSPATSSPGTNGVEIEVSKTQNISLERGDPADPTQASQLIAMTPGQILIDAQKGSLVLSSLTSIHLVVGQSSITIDTTGITIIGKPLVQINPVAPPLTYLYPPNDPMLEDPQSQPPPPPFPQ